MPTSDSTPLNAETLMDELERDVKALFGPERAVFWVLVTPDDASGYMLGTIPANATDLSPERIETKKWMSAAGNTFVSLIAAARARISPAPANAGDRDPKPVHLNSDGAFDVRLWIKDMVDGPFGFNAYTHDNIVIWDDGKERALANWVLQCVAKPECAGSTRVLEAIIAARNGTLSITPVSAALASAAAKPSPSEKEGA